MRGSVVSCENMGALYLWFAFGISKLKSNVPQASNDCLIAPHTVTTTIFPTLQTVVVTLVMLQSTKDGDTECYSTTKQTEPLKYLLLFWLHHVSNLPLLSTNIWPDVFVPLIYPKPIISACGLYPSGNTPLVPIDGISFIHTNIKCPMRVYAQ